MSDEEQETAEQQDKNRIAREVTKVAMESGVVSGDLRRRLMSAGCVRVDADAIIRQYTMDVANLSISATASYFMDEFTNV